MEIAAGGLNSVLTTATFDGCDHTLGIGHGRPNRSATGMFQVSSVFHHHLSDLSPISMLIR